MVSAGSDTPKNVANRSILASGGSKGTEAIHLPIGVRRSSRTLVSSSPFATACELRRINESPREALNGSEIQCHGLQAHRLQGHSEDLRGRGLRHHRLCVRAGHQVIGGAPLHASRAAPSLFQAGQACEARDQGAAVAARIVHVLPHEGGVHHVHNVRDRHRRLGDVGAQDDLPSPFLRRLEDLLLLVNRHVRVQHEKGHRRLRPVPLERLQQRGSGHLNLVPPRQKHQNRLPFATPTSASITSMQVQNRLDEDRVGQISVGELAAAGARVAGLLALEPRAAKAIAGYLPRQVLQEVGVHGEGPARNLEHRRIAEVATELVGLDGGAHDDDAQVWQIPNLRQQDAEQEVGVETPFVSFIDEDVRDPLEALVLIKRSSFCRSSESLQ
eukprot:scaffold434_cov186-Pinguiococcus_pyrenoidosus.AAC.133